MCEKQSNGMTGRHPIEEAISYTLTEQCKLLIQLVISARQRHIVSLWRKLRKEVTDGQTQLTDQSSGVKPSGAKPTFSTVLGRSGG